MQPVSLYLWEEQVAQQRNIKLSIIKEKLTLKMQNTFTAQTNRNTLSIYAMKFNTITRTETFNHLLSALAVGMQSIN